MLIQYTFFLLEFVGLTETLFLTDRMKRTVENKHIVNEISCKNNLNLTFLSIPLFIEK